MSEASDQALTERRPARSREALEDVLRQHRPLICRLCRRVIDDDGDLEDVVQDVLVAIAAGIHRFRGQARLSTWIAKVTIRTAMRHAQRQRRWHQTMTSLEVAPNHIPVHASVGGNPAETVENREFRHHLQAAIQALPPQQRAVIALRHMEGMQIQEVAEALGTPIGTVKSRLHHARRALRSLMAPYLDGQIGR